MNTHLENRAWAFQALDQLEAFLRDEDFERDPEEEGSAIHRKRKELKDGKYRVVFVGTFNVGKSTLINALLGDVYLPTVLEECTTKIIHVVRATELRTVISLREVVTESEMNTLAELLKAYDTGASIELLDDRHELEIKYAYASAGCVRQTLDALTTMRADEDFPHMRGLREKFEELFIYAPTDRLEEDISLVDSPGAHSINETNQRIAEEIIPHSHLVVCMLDSQNAGNEQNRGFIERVVQQRRRKMFFVINKADQLNPDEIDPTMRRGPAKDLGRCLEEVVANPEVFFVSSLYGLFAARLESHRMSLDDLDKDNKVRIPYAERRRLEESDDPARDAAKYLEAASRLGIFRNRLFDYLYTENREGAIVESVCCFIDSLAWKFARPLEVRLELARSVPRLAQIGREHGELSQELERMTRAVEAVTTEYKLAAAGGERNGRQYPGYEGLVESHLNKASVEKLFFGPLREWILKDDNFKSAQQTGFKQLTKSLDKRLDAYLSQIQSDINSQMGSVEQRTLRAAGEIAPDMPEIPFEPVKASKVAVEDVNVSLTGSYFGFLIAGALIGQGIVGGAAILAMQQPEMQHEIAEWVGQIPNLDAMWGRPFEATLESVAILGVIVGAVCGGILGLIGRALTAGSARRKKLARGFCEKVDQILLRGYRDGVGKQVPSVRAQLMDRLSERRDGFGGEIKQALDAVVDELKGRLFGLKTEEAELKRIQAETIARLEPKLAQLREIAGKAREISSVDRGDSVPAPVSLGTEQSRL